MPHSRLASAWPPVAWSVHLTWRPVWKDLGGRNTAASELQADPASQFEQRSRAGKVKVPLHFVLCLFPRTGQGHSGRGAERVLGAQGCWPLSVSCCGGLPERDHVWSDWGRGGRAYALGIWPTGQQCLHYFPTSL